MHEAKNIVAVDWQKKWDEGFDFGVERPTEVDVKEKKEYSSDVKKPVGRPKKKELIVDDGSFGPEEENPQKVLAWVGDALGKYEAGIPVKMSECPGALAWGMFNRARNSDAAWDKFNQNWFQANKKNSDDGSEDQVVIKKQDSEILAMLEEIDAELAKTLAAAQ